MYHHIIKKVKSAFENAQKNMGLVKATMLECSKALRSLKDEHLRKAESKIAKQAILNQIAVVKGYKIELRKLIRTSGSGLHNKKRESWPSSRVRWVDADSAFDGRIRTGVINNLVHKDPKAFLKDCSKVFHRKIKNILRAEAALKVNAVICGEFHIIKAGSEIIELKYMNTKNVAIYRETDLGVWFEEHIQDVVMKKLEEFQERDSGWALSTIINLLISINKFTLQLGSSFIELPKQIVMKKACVNVKNNDNACFAWAVISALHPVDRMNHPDRVSSYPEYRGILDLKGIQFPMTVKQIPRFEKQNGISINLYILKRDKKQFIVLPAYLAKDKRAQHINLLMIQNIYYNEDKDDDVNSDVDDVEPIRYHFVWLKNLSRLLSSQLSRHDGQKYFCDRCLHYFYSQAQLEKHMEDCRNLNSCRIRMPSEDDKFLSFKNYKNKTPAPFVIYADLECLLMKSTPLENLTSRRRQTSSIAYQEHIPYSAAYYVKCAYDPTVSFYESYRGNDCIEWFVHELENFAGMTEALFLDPLPMNPLSIDQNREFELASICYICEKPFTTEDVKAHDHCHLTGNYRGPAHMGCNINFKDTHTIPIIFHNLSGYDSHFIIKNIARDLKGRVDLLPINKERYISFTKRLDEYVIKFRFIDSFKFLASSLDNLAASLKTFPHLKTEFKDLSDDQFKLLTRKGVYPYDYCDDESKFLETSLPDISKFYNKLTDSQISDKDYDHAKKIWNELHIRNLGQYSDLYLKTDVLLLADIFEKFRASCHLTYGLDPAHYFTVPGYTWDAMLKYTDVTLELLTDVDIHMFIEQGIRGGLSQCSKRYSKANNKYMPNFDSSQPSKYLMYFDVNNQYGWAMSQYLPHSDFKWVEDLSNFNVEDIPDESDIGYILKVDLEYPCDLHNQHSDLPFCPVHTIPPKSKSKQKKLMGTLYNKEQYILHYRSLKQALKYGLKIVKIYQILEYKQSAWLKPYIDLNTSLRAKADNKFDIELFKLMNNAVFGKTMENIRKHSIVKLVTKWSGRYGAEAYISKPEFKASTIFNSLNSNENLVAIELNKTEIFFNKPIYVGMSVLDLAKTTIYDFHYGYMALQFGSDCTVCYTDTDSLIYEVTCDDFYQNVKRDCSLYFDTSDYPSDNIHAIPHVNKKVLGMMKDENNGKIMTEFVGLRSKMYAFRIEGEETYKSKKSKGVKRYIVENKLKFDDYVNCLNNSEEKKLEQNLIQSRKHEVNSITQKKIALSPHDDKRFLLGDSHETLPWGHHSIIEID